MGAAAAVLAVARRLPHTDQELNPLDKLSAASIPRSTLCCPWAARGARAFGGRQPGDQFSADSRRSSAADVCAVGGLEAYAASELSPMAPGTTSGSSDSLSRSGVHRQRATRSLEAAWAICAHLAVTDRRGEHVARGVLRSPLDAVARFALRRVAEGLKRQRARLSKQADRGGSRRLHRPVRRGWRCGYGRHGLKATRRLDASLRPDQRRGFPALYRLRASLPGAEPVPISTMCRTERRSVQAQAVVSLRAGTSGDKGGAGLLGFSPPRTRRG
jgi:hypothetical protein